MANEAGMPTDQIRAVIEGDHSAMSSDSAMGFRFAHHVLGGEPSAPDLPADVRARWGEEALAEMALGVTTARMFPQMKRGLGRERACSRLSVDGSVLSPSAIPVASAMTFFKAPQSSTPSMSLFS